MSSIIYVSDNNMLEYHRLHGHKAMNFWRFENGKQFTKFIVGDLLFFLAKKSERNNSKEKGIVGYGRLQHNTSMSVAKMWKEYQDLNGFSTKEELREVIKKLSKNNKVPRKMNCLFLDDVIFFNAPVYLSEFDVKISNHLESYLYLEDSTLENKILTKAEEIGVDTWASMITSQSSTDFRKQQILNDIYALNKDLSANYYDEKHQKIVKNQLEAYQMNNQKFQFIKGSSSVLVNVNEETVSLVFVNVAKSQKSANYQRLLGYMLLYKIRIIKMNLKCHFIVLNNLENESGNEVLKWINY